MPSPSKARSMPRRSSATSSSSNGRRARGGFSVSRRSTASPGSRSPRRGGACIAGWSRCSTSWRSDFPSPAMRALRQTLRRVARAKPATGEGLRGAKALTLPLLMQWVPPSPAVRERGLSESRVIRLEARLVLLGITGIIEAQRRVALLDSRPQRLAQFGGEHHRGEATQQRRARPASEIGGEQRRLRRRVERVVDGEAGKIEERRAETGEFPVDQPEPRAIVDDVAGHQVVVGERQSRRPDRVLEGIDDGAQARDTPGRNAIRFERGEIVAQRVEDPETWRRTAQMRGDLAMAAPQ